MRSGAVLFLAVVACAQQQAPYVGPYVDPQTAAIFTRIAQHAARLGPMLEQVRAADWVAKGAADTYVAQLASARTQMQAIESDMNELARQPDRMVESMKGLFRVQAFHRSLDSLMGGLRKYQNPSLADLIESVAAEDQADLDALQSHILELATAKEQELQVVDKEAQRCRTELSRQPARPKTPPKNP